MLVEVEKDDATEGQKGTVVVQGMEKGTMGEGKREEGRGDGN